MKVNKFGRFAAACRIGAGMTRGIVLAAGASTRMGRAKALLPAGGATFVRTILAALHDGGVADAVVVIGPDHDAVAAEIAAAGYGRAVINSRPDEGQLSSLLAGLAAIDGEDLDAALVTLVDVPLVAAATIRLLLARAAASPAPIVRAVHGGRHGHPVIFSRRVFAALRAADPAIGAKAVVRSAGVEDIEVADPGVLVDVDTPADYARLFGNTASGC
jgi:molybdenum cofactor cytidylyltransferase